MTRTELTAKALMKIFGNLKSEPYFITRIIDVFDSKTFW